MLVDAQGILGVGYFCPARASGWPSGTGAREGPQESAWGAEAASPVASAFRGLGGGQEAALATRRVSPPSPRVQIMFPQAPLEGACDSQALGLTQGELPDCLDSWWGTGPLHHQQDQLLVSEVRSILSEVRSILLCSLTLTEMDLGLVDLGRHPNFLTSVSQPRQRLPG